MDKLFLTVVNMSITGAFVIAAICLARLPLRKAPKVISYCLWAVAGFRLAFPFSIESVLSLIPFKAQPIPTDIATAYAPRIESGIPFVNNAPGGLLPAAEPAASANPLQIWAAVGAYVWLIGALALLGYGAASYILLKRKMRASVCAQANIYKAENIKSPFVLGIFRPKIYLPSGLDAQECRYIILHEQTHIRRRDHIVKFFAYFILCLHWFNPLAWAAFWLMGADMEMSCDERVLKTMGGEMKKEYSLSLLSLATQRRAVGGARAAFAPLAFGEGGIKGRVKNVLNFKKASRLIVLLAILLAAALSVGFALSRGSGKGETPDPAAGWKVNVPADSDKSGENARDSAYAPWEWLDYLFDTQMPWEGSEEISLPEYPGVTFKWTPDKITARDSEGEREILSGMPVWSVYFADLTGDGLPELCATVSVGSGIVDTRVKVYDCASGTGYELSNRMYYGDDTYTLLTYYYALSLLDGRLMVMVTLPDLEKSMAMVYGELAIVDGKLTAKDIDSIWPMPQVTQPITQETQPPNDAPAAGSVLTITQSSFIPRFMLHDNDFDQLGHMDDEITEYIDLDPKEVFGGVSWADRIWKVLRADVGGEERDLEAEREAGGVEAIYKRYRHVRFYVILNEEKSYEIPANGELEYYYDCYEFSFDITEGAPLESEMLALIRDEIAAKGFDTEQIKSAESMLYEGFYKVILALYDMNGTSGSKYIAVDMTGVPESARKPLEEAVGAWAETLGRELLVDTYDGLVASGYIVPATDGYWGVGFDGGALYSFENAALEGNTLTVTAGKYSSPLAATGADFTVRYDGDGNWVLEQPERMWIS
ncbi:MAG: M56 family metallopeptidase [Oscillospiraceae bacterium]|jgi:beta-lactamase regulating signal transducer with metallopeptidase domain|nr:M56 family metallopeptidase [Oscillospiraceae bacterium]